MAQHLPSRSELGDSAGSPGLGGDDPHGGAKVPSAQGPGVVRLFRARHLVWLIEVGMVLESEEEAAWFPPKVRRR